VAPRADTPRLWFLRCLRGTVALLLVIDTHSHLLPGIDDGAATLDESVSLAREAAAAGVREIVCTPHLRLPDDPAADRAPDVLLAVQAALDAGGIPIRLHLGYELAFSFAAGLEPEQLALYTIGATSTFLVEIPHVGWPPLAERTVHRWRLQGFIPILAHPERCDRAQRDPALVETLLRLGAVAQGTTPSLMGSFGAASRRLLLRLLAGGGLSLLASDTHFGRSGGRDLPAATRRLLRYSPNADVRTLTEDNPARLLRGEPLLAMEPVRVYRPWETYLRRVW
jgi:protein-tyrosine phosphatase